MITHLTATGVENYATSMSQIYGGDKEKVDKAVASLIRGSGILESGTPGDKETVMAILLSSPSAVVGAISSQPTPERMAAVLNRVADTVADLGGSPTLVYGLLGDLSPRIPDGNPRELFWQTLFANLPRAIPAPPTVEEIAPIYQRIGTPEIREGLVSFLEASNPIAPPGWGVALNDAILGQNEVTIRGVVPDGSLASITQLMVAAQNPNLSADTLTVPLLHVAQDPVLSQQVLPSLMSSGVAMGTLNRVITNSPELAGYIADRIRAGDLVGPAAKGLQSIPAVRSQLVHQLDQAIMTDVVELPLASGKTLNRDVFTADTVTSFDDFKLRLDRSGVKAPADRQEAIDRWKTALNATPQIAMTMTHYFPKLSEVLSAPNITALGASRSGDISRYKEGLSNNPQFSEVLGSTLHPDNPLIQAVSDIPTATAVIDVALTRVRDLDDLQDLMDITLNNKDFLRGPQRGKAMLALTTHLAQLPDPTGRQVKNILLDYSNRSASGAEPVEKELKVAAASTLIEQGDGNALTGDALLSYIKSSGTVPMLTVPMADHLAALDRNIPGPDGVVQNAMTRFTQKYPDLALDVKSVWPRGSVMPGALDALEPAAQPASHGRADANLPRILAMAPNAVDRVTVEMMLQNAASNEVVLGQTMSEMATTINQILTAPPPPPAGIWGSPVLQVLTSPSSNGVAILDRLTGLAASASGSNLNNRVQVLMDDMRAGVVGHFAKAGQQPDTPLAERASQLKLAYQLCSGGAGEADRARLVKLFLDSPAIASLKPKDAAAEIMTALATISGDGAGQDISKQVLLAYMSRTDGHAASIMNRINDFPAVSESVLHSVDEIKKSPGKIGPALAKEVDRFVTNKMGFPSHFAAGQFNQVNQPETAETKFIKANARDVLMARMSSYPDHFNEDMTRFMTTGLRESPGNPDLVALFGKIVADRPDITASGIFSPYQSWVQTTLTTVATMTPTALATQFEIDEATLRRNMDPLIESGWVTTNREKQYLLTPQGVARLEELPINPDTSKALKPLADATIGHVQVLTVDEIRQGLLSGKHAHDELIGAALSNHIGDNKTVFARLIGRVDPVSTTRSILSAMNLMDPIKQPSTEQIYVANSVLAKFPEQAKKLVNDEANHPINIWAPQLAYRSNSGDSIEHASRILGVYTENKVYGRLDISNSITTLDFKPATDQLQAKATASGLSGDTSYFVSVPMTQVGPVTFRVGIPETLFNAAVAEPEGGRVESPTELAYKGYMIAMGLSDAAAQVRPIADANAPRLASMGIDTTRVDTAASRLRALVSSDPARGDESKELNGKRMVTEMAADGYSMTEILIAARTMELANPGVTPLSKLRETITKVGPAELMAAAVTGAEHRARVPGADVVRVKNQLMTDWVMIRNLAGSADDALWKSVAVALDPESPAEPASPLTARVNTLGAPPPAAAAGIIHQGGVPLATILKQLGDLV